MATTDSGVVTLILDRLFYKNKIYLYNNVVKINFCEQLKGAVL